MTDDASVNFFGSDSYMSGRLGMYISSVAGFSLSEKFHRRVKKPKKLTLDLFFFRKKGKQITSTYTKWFADNLRKYTIFNIRIGICYFSDVWWLQTWMKFNVSFQIILVLRTLDNFYFEIILKPKLFWYIV